MHLLCRCLFLLAAASAYASNLDTIGVTLLRSFDPTLLGAGIPVGQVEADAPGWQVDPAAVGQPVSLFTYYSATGTSSTYPNSLGTDSWHAEEVGRTFYGTSYGPAPGVFHVHNYDAGYFTSDVIPNQLPTAARVVNQSFIFTEQLPTVDQDYDDYAARYNVLFVSGPGNGGEVMSPSTAYNSIAVAAYGGSSSVGPTADGRAKPDIAAPASLTSFSTPLVAGVASLLLQAVNRDDGGSNSAAAASDIRVLKALLLNGAQKPPGWTNSSITPLDLRYGAGVVNAFESWRQLRGGKHVAQITTQVTVGGAHPPPTPTGAYSQHRGWDFATASSTVIRDSISHYFLDVQGASNHVFRATLVWNRQQGQSAINDLNLFLYDSATGNLVASSQSLVDNVEHLYVTNLSTGTYDLQVFKSGGKRITSDEEYALAFDIGPSQPAEFVGSKVLAGNFNSTLVGEPNQDYRIEATTDFSNWTSVSTNRTSSAGSVAVSVSAPGARRFFRALELP